MHDQWILDGIKDEMARQVAKWGEQEHPGGTGGWPAAMEANYYRNACDGAAKDGTVTWRHILLEEVYEALAETDPERLTTELIQVAAVCGSWIRDLDVRGSAAA